MIKDVVFKDKNFVLTSVNFQNEKPMTEIITKLGGKVRSSAVKDTDYVIYGDTETTKYKKAMELKSKGRNITFIEEHDFVEYLNSLISKINQKGE